MLTRLSIVGAIALIAVGTISMTALAQVDVGPTEPEAEISQYVDPDDDGDILPEQETGEPPTEEEAPAPQPPAPDVAAGGGLAFTGLMILPQILVALALLFPGIALHRWNRKRAS